MEDGIKALYELTKDYQELADMIPIDHPGARLLPRLNTDLMKLSIELLTALDQVSND